ncbi:MULTISPECIES: hypothetical protein [unclassified Streptomyces]|uniref:hypothetical protein n=1 Tax=unclassified Streptomyces TaxID=2593676 RepID=UPI002DD827FF|nr:hypothetical protein [Streptomyces sp. NBC_01750]WSB01187.1 hypothetical protein OIE54_18825 [Streptomyces sp. NBC_01794]WSD34457.1 hypothetical protein OG966_22770 [Streptomyces sp. NBC_01750]
MSGFTTDRKYYGDRLVYEPLESKWGRYHATHCGCGQDWLTVHAVPAGFTVIPRGKTGYYGLVGPGLTANALWEAVTGKPGTQTWHEGVHITCRSPESEAKRKAANDEYYGRIREESAKRKAAAKKEPITPAQLKYLTSSRRRWARSGSTPSSSRRSRAPTSSRVLTGRRPPRPRSG